jgi:hypothetical protein
VGNFPQPGQARHPLSSFFSKKNRASFPNEMFHDAQNVPRSEKKSKEFDRTKKIVIL